MKNYRLSKDNYNIANLSCSQVRSVMARSVTPYTDTNKCDDRSMEVYFPPLCNYDRPTDQQTNQQTDQQQRSDMRAQREVILPITFVFYPALQHGIITMH